MASFSYSSTSYTISTSSESENENGSNIKFNSVNKIDFNNISSTFKTSLASNLSRETSNNSLRYFKKLKRKNNLHESKIHKYSTKQYTSPTLKTNHNLPKSKNKSNSKKKKKVRKNTFSNSVNLNKEFANAFESSIDSDFTDLKYLKFISKNSEINTSSISNESKQSKSFLTNQNIKSSTINNLNNNKKHIKCFDSSTSSSSLDFSQINIDFSDIKQRRNNEFNLDGLLSDQSLSDGIIRKDDSDRNSQLYSTPVTNDSFPRLKSISPKPLPLNVSLGIDNEPLLQNPLSITLNIPDLTSDAQNQIVIDMDKQEKSIINEHNKINKSKLFLNENNLNEQDPTSNSIKSIEEKSVNSEPNGNYCNPYKLKKVSKNTSHISSEIKENNEKNKKQNKSKHLHSKIVSNTSNVLQIKKTNKQKKISNQHTVNKIKDIGLEYDTSKDNYMVELPNGALVPAFLSTLNPKYVRKVCACGITTSEIPLSWSESFHDILHQNIHKLFFKGVISDNDPINIKQNDLSYRILILRMNNYNDEYIKKSVKNVDDFVCLEYGIFKTGIESYKDLTTYLALLPNFKVIGYLEVKPIQKAYKFNQNEPVSEITVPAKFGVSKMWVLIKYRNQNVDINLLEVLREKEKLQKEDLAFSLDGCLEVQFIQKYTGNTNILIYD